MVGKVKILAIYTNLFAGVSSFNKSSCDDYSGGYGCC